MTKRTEDARAGTSADGPSLAEVEAKPEPIAEDEPISTAPHKHDAEEPCAGQPLALRVEALLIGTDRPLNETRIAKLLGLSGKSPSKDVGKAIDELNRQYEQAGRAFRIEKIAGGLQILTLPEFGPVLASMHTDRQHTRLSQPALETLSITAYRQPILRAEIESIRGVACGEVLRGLLERRLIKIVGRAEELGRPMLYGTTREFLNVFGLASLDDLPALEGVPGSDRRQEAPRAEEAAPVETGAAVEPEHEPEPDKETDESAGAEPSGT